MVTDSRGTDFGADDQFGSALAIGDFNDDGADDVAIGVPDESPGGAVRVMYGSTDGLTGSGADQA